MQLRMYDDADFGLDGPGADFALKQLKPWTCFPLYQGAAQELEKVSNTTGLDISLVTADDAVQ